MKVLVTGASGLLGWDIADAFQAAGHTVKRLLGRKDVNILDTKAVADCVGSFAPDLVVHAAGYRDLDDMEQHPHEGYAINTLGTWNMTLACRAANCKLIYISSDTVFDGEKSDGYHEFDTPCPVNVYGKSKLAAEQVIRSLWEKHFIVRTALLFGYKGHRENSFIYHIVDELTAGRSISASEDQICCPSYTADLAKALVELGQTEWYGTYHLTNSGTASRCDISRAVARLAGLDPELVKPAKSSTTKIARRAKNTVFRSLAWPAAFGYELPPWEEALARCWKESQAQETKALHQDAR